MSSYYSVMCSDLRKRRDHAVARRVNRRAAWLLATSLNLRAVASGGRTAPLYYLLRRERRHAPPCPPPPPVR